MLRLESLSASSKTYLPAGSTCPGISTGSLNWNTVFLFHSSAIAGFVTKNVSVNKPPTHIAFNLLFIFVSPLSYVSFQTTLGQVDIRTVDLDFKGVSFIVS